MKARIATLASLAGVLVAGSAAAMVNSQVLHNASLLKNSVQNVAPLTVQSSAPNSSTITVPAAGPVVVDTSTGTQPSVSTEVTEPATTNAPTTARPRVVTQARYRIGDAGDVLLDTVHDSLTIVSTGASPGWRVTRARNTDVLNTFVTFQSSTRRVVFHASLLFGVVNYTVITYDLLTGRPVTTAQPDPTNTQVTTPSVTTAPPTTRPREPHHQPQPGPSTTVVSHNGHDSDHGPTSTTPRWGSGNGQDD
ncbi:MAG: hypothetical protein WCI22_00950 [Actinomycetota bacterium]